MKFLGNVAVMVYTLAALSGCAICLNTSLSKEFYDYSKAEEELKTYTIQRDIVYAVGAVNDGSDTLDLTLDAYVPDSMEEYSKAAMLVIHAGGFRKGSKNARRYVAMAKYFAERGFVAFSMNYRKQADKAHRRLRGRKSGAAMDPRQPGQLRNRFQ